MLSPIRAPILGLAYWTGYSPTIPKLYWDVYSQEERMKRLSMQIDRMEQYDDYLVKALNSALDAQDKEMEEFLEQARKELALLRTEIMEILQGLELGTLQWDCQTGWYANTVDAQRDMFNDLTVHALNVDQLNELDLTVDTLANCGLNCRGLAVMSRWLLDSSIDVPDEYMYA